MRSISYEKLNRYGAKCTVSRYGTVRHRLVVMERIVPPPHIAVERNWETAMRQRRFPVLLDTARGRVPARFSAPAGAEPVEIALRLREKGWTAYRIRYDSVASAWIATVIDWKRAA